MAAPVATTADTTHLLGLSCSIEQEDVQHHSDLGCDLHHYPEAERVWAFTQRYGKYRKLVWTSTVMLSAPAASLTSQLSRVIDGRYRTWPKSSVSFGEALSLANVRIEAFIIL